jgi:hypothetical protein
MFQKKISAKLMPITKKVALKKTPLRPAKKLNKNIKHVILTNNNRLIKKEK